MFRLIATLILGLLAAPAFASFPVTVSTTEVAGVARSGEFVTFGVPFSRADALLSTSNLTVYLGGTQKEAQFNVTSRWDGAPTDTSKPIRWVLVTLKVDTLSASAAADYEVRNTGASAVTGISVTDVAGKYTVDTGAATFEISKTTFNLFDRVMVGAAEVVASGASVGGKIIDSSSGVASARGGASYVANVGTYLSTGATILSTTIEDISGPLHTVISVRGKGTNGGGDHLEWLARMHFYKGSTDARVVYTFTDRSLPDYRDRYDIDYVGLGVKIKTTGDPSVTASGATGGTSVSSATVTSGNSVVLRQTGTVEQSLDQYEPGAVSALSWAISGSGLSASGNRNRGWLRSGDGSVGVLVSVLDFWKMYPKRLDADNSGNVNVVLWPSEDADMTVYSGAQRTHEVLYHFFTGTLNDASSEQIVGQFQSPLLMLPTPEYISSSQGFGPVGTLKAANYPSDMQGLVGSLVTKVNGIYDTVEAARNDKYGKHSYGMWAYGAGVPDVDGYWAANDYDLVRQYLLIGAATDSAAYRNKWLSLAKATARHSGDVYLSHTYQANRPGLGSNGTAVVRNGNTTAKKYLGWPAYNPCDKFHNMGTSDYLGSSPNIHHVAGAQGLSYLYFLTGDLMARDVALDQRYYLRTMRQLWDAGSNEARTYGQFTSIWLGAYSLTGDANDLDDLNYWLDYARGKQTATNTYDPTGKIWTGSADTTIGTVSFMNSLMFIALTDTSVVLPGRSDVEQSILDAADFTQDQTKHLWSDANKWYYRDKNSSADPGFRYSASAGMGYAYHHSNGATKARYKQIVVDAYTAGLAAETVGKEKDASSILRALPSTLYYFQSGLASPSPAAHTLGSFKLSGSVR